MNIDELANKARKIAFEKKVSTNSILKPMLIKHGFEDENGINPVPYSITISYYENLNKVPTKEIMEEFKLV